MTDHPEDMSNSPVDHSFYHNIGYGRCLMDFIYLDINTIFTFFNIECINTGAASRTDAIKGIKNPTVPWAMQTVLIVLRTFAQWPTLVWTEMI